MMMKSGLEKIILPDLTYNQKNIQTLHTPTRKYKWTKLLTLEFTTLCLKTMVKSGLQKIIYSTCLARTDLLYMLNWGTQWTMVSYF